MATTIDVDLIINTADSAKNIADIQKNIKALKTAASEVGDGGKGFQALIAKSAELRDKIDDLKDATSSLKGSGIEKLNASMGLLKEGFVNADPGKLSIGMKTLGAAMKAIPIFLIIEGIKYLVENFEKLKNSGGLVGKVFRAIGEAIDWVIEKISEFTDWLGITNNAQEKLSETTIQNAKDQEKALQSRYDGEIKLAKAAGKDVTDLEIKKQEAVIASCKTQFEAIKALAVSTGEITADQKKAVVELGTTIKNAQLEIQAQIIARDTKTKDEQKKNADKAAADHKAALDKQRAADLAYYNARADLENAAQDKREALTAALKAKAIALNNDEELRLAGSEQRKLEIVKDRQLKELQSIYDHSDQTVGAQKALASAQLAVQNKFIADVDKANLTADAKRAADEKVAADKRKAENDKQNQQILAGINSLAASISSILGSVADYNQLKADEAVKVQEDSLNTQLNALNDSRDAELNKEGLTAAQKIAIQNKYALQEYALKLDAYKKETEIKKKAFEQDKKLKIAQAVISTITGAVAAVTGMIQAIPGPVGIVLGALAGVAVVAAGAVQIAKIKAQTFDAGTPPAAPSLSVPGVDGGGGAASPTATDNPRLFAINGDQNTGSGSGQRQSQDQPIKAYVVSQEVTQSQNMSNVIERRSSF